MVLLGISCHCSANQFHVYFDLKDISIEDGYCNIDFIHVDDFMEHKTSKV